MEIESEKERLREFEVERWRLRKTERDRVAERERRRDRVRGIEMEKSSFRFSMNKQIEFERGLEEEESLKGEELKRKIEEEIEDHSRDWRRSKPTTISDLLFTIGNFL